MWKIIFHFAKKVQLVNINVSSLATGVYLLKVYNHENTLITTTRFNKI